MIKQNIMINDYSEAGLRMFDLVLFNKALKSTWVKKKNLDPENRGRWKYPCDWQLHLYGGPAIFRANLNKQDMSKYITTTDTFTMEILHLWAQQLTLEM